MRTALNRSNKFLGNLGEMANTAPAEIPITEFGYIDVALPVSADQLQRDFGLIIDPLQVAPGSSSPDGNRVSSLVRSQTVEEFIYATHVGVVVVPEPKVFALNGADVLAPAAPATTPAFDGFMPPAGLPGDAAARPAQLEWGHATWQAAWSLLNAYTLDMSIGSKFTVFSELAANVGACVSGGFRGLGQNVMPATPYIRSVNDLADSRVAPATGRRYFIPQTVTAGVGGGPATPAQPPLVQVSYGGTQLQGAFGGWYPLTGLLLAPGMPINILMRRAAFDASYHARMTAALSDMAQVFTTYGKNLTEGVTGGIGFAGAKVWKGGLFRIGILIRGFALAPLACYQGYQDMGRFFNSVDKAMMYRDSASIMAEMAPKVVASHGHQILGPSGRTLAEEVAADKNVITNLGNLKGIDQYDWSRLALPAAH